MDTVKKTKHLLLWSSVGAFVLLVLAAVNENFLRDWRLIQKTGKADDGPAEVRLRQIVNPSLNVTDRCVSCHVSMAPGEQNVTGHEILTAHKPVVHDVSEFGCTVCHGGQGPATEKDDAHGDVHFWPEPMIPRKYAHAGCGTCHAPLGVPNRDVLARDRALFERHDCLACHRLDGRGGTIRPGGAGGMEGPDLSRVGIKGFDPGWYDKHLAKHASATEGPWKFSFGPIPDADRAGLTGFLSVQMAAPALVEAKAEFLSAGCLGCHKVGGVGGDDGVDLTHSGEKDPGRLDFSNVPGARTVSNWMAEHFRAPGTLVPNSQMPTLGLSERQIDLLTMYVMSLRRRDVPGSYMPKDRLKAEKTGEREFAADGETLYGAFCLACHGPSGKGMRYGGTQPFPAVGNPDFLNAASDEFIAETIRNGRPGRRMPAWGNPQSGLRPDEIDKIVAYLRRLNPPAEPPAVASLPGSAPVPGNRSRPDANLGGRLYAASCSGCHGKKGEGADGPALNNPVFLKSASDEFLIQTIDQGRRGTTMEGFGKPSTARRTLSRTEIESVVAYIRTLGGGKK